MEEGGGGKIKALDDNEVPSLVCHMKNSKLRLGRVC